MSLDVSLFEVDFKIGVTGVVLFFILEPEQNYHMVVDCAHAVLREHCYWPIVSDLINVLSHKPIAHKFMENDTLLQFWFELISYFQGAFDH